MENLPRENHLDAEKKPKPKLKRSLSSTTRYGFPIIETNKIGEKTTEHAQHLLVAFHSTPKKKIPTISQSKQGRTFPYFLPNRASS